MKILKLKKVELIKTKKFYMKNNLVKFAFT